MKSKRPPRAVRPRAAARAAGGAVDAKLGRTEIGVAGFKVSGGLLDEEIFRELQGARGLKTYTEMQADPILGAAMSSIDLLMSSAKSEVSPASQEPQDIEAADFVQSCLDDLSTAWTETRSEFGSMLPYGWAAHEIVYKVRAGAAASPGESSRFTDGRIGWRKLAPRAPTTLSRGGGGRLGPGFAGRARG